MSPGPRRARLTISCSSAGSTPTSEAHGDQIAGGLDDARGTEAVAVERRADVAAVGEDQRRRPVPRLADAATGTRRRRGRRAADRDRAPRPAAPAASPHARASSRCAAAARSHRRATASRSRAPEIGDSTLNAGQRGRIGGARAHPQPVAGDGVDLAVVRERPERLRQRPVGGRVGAEALMERDERRDEPRVGEIRIKPIERVRASPAPCSTTVRVESETMVRRTPAVARDAARCAAGRGTAPRRRPAAPRRSRRRPAAPSAWCRAARASTAARSVGTIRQSIERAPAWRSSRSTISAACNRSCGWTNSMPRPRVRAAGKPPPNAASSPAPRESRSGRRSRRPRRATAVGAAVGQAAQRRRGRARRCRGRRRRGCER